MTRTLVVRAPRRDEPAEIARLINTASRAEHGVDEVSEREVRHWFTLPKLDVERDVFVVEEGGRPTAYADVGDESERGEQFWIDLRLPPQASIAAGEALLAAAERRIAELAAERPREGERRTLVWIPSVNERLAELLEAAGFRRYRYSFRMAIDLDESLPEPRLPDGIEMRTFTAADERAVFEAVNEAFEDTWDYVPWDFEEWRHWGPGREEFDPSLWFVAWDGGEVAGVSLCRPHESEPDIGWVSSLAVRRPWRRRGLARALLLESFREFARRGYARVALGVDADSLTGAHRLYESAGMRPVRRHDVYEKHLP